jgi:hypothetical protein
VARTYEHSNKFSGSIIGRELLVQLSNCQLLKKDSAPWSYKLYVTGRQITRRLCMWEAAAGIYFKMLPPTLLKATEKNHEELSQNGLSID